MRAVIGAGLVGLLGCGRAPAGTAAPVEPAPASEPEGDRGAVPRVHVEPVTVGPKWSPAMVKRVVRTRMPEIERCQAGALDAPPVTLRFAIGADGLVSSAEALVAGGADSSHPAHACVLAEIRALRFPADMTGLIITYPLR
ncbi:MAG TPA: hypothetical protein VGB85_11795 [Nannocystis sp.]|jgi:hypothetical protein